MQTNRIQYNFVDSQPQEAKAKPAGTTDFQDILETCSMPESSMKSMEQKSLPHRTQFDTYRIEQLLSNPGAKTVDYETGKITSTQARDMSWGNRIAKDFHDSILNLRNFFLNGTVGADKNYVDPQGKVGQAKSSAGLLGSLVDFFKDMASALSFGLYRPDGEPAPDNPVEAFGFAASKLKEAIGGDLIGGTLGSLVQMGEDLILSGWNLVEAAPDILLGGFDAGRVAVDTIFDNGQVAIDYITDVVPGGEAWMRVHAWDIEGGHLPVIYNLKTPEQFPDDQRWEFVSNTPFRKSIETIGSLLADAALVYTLSQGITSSDSRHK